MLSLAGSTSFGTGTSVHFDLYNISQSVMGFGGAGGMSYGFQSGCHAGGRLVAIFARVFSGFVTPTGSADIGGTAFATCHPHSDNCPVLKISLLGPFSVTQNDTSVIGFKTDYSRAILAMTAYHRGVPQRRDALAGMLWPDAPNDKALKYFRVELNRLRPVIGDADANPPHYFINRKEIEFNPDSAAVVDVVVFESLLDEVRQHGHRTLAGCPSCIGKLEQAAELYQGEFMAGFHLNSDIWQQWLTKQREGFKLQALELFGLLSGVQQERGRWEAVLQLGQKQLELDPWHEGAYQALMRASYSLGDRAGAMGWYETCEKVLYEELGVDPSAETLDLQQQILDDELEFTSIGSASIPNNLPEQTAPFFGRQQELGTIINQLVDPNTRLISLVGIGGMGKSRLALEVGAQVKESFPDGVWFVPLADIRPDSADSILNAIADALRLERDGKKSIGDQLLEFMRDKRLLLVLDNLEHILDEVINPLTLFFERTKQMAVLATSREPLNLLQETVVNLSGLGEAAIQLFAERAAKVRSDFEITPENRPLIEKISQLVGGSPLAISLAAAWVRRRTPQQIIDAIGQSMDFLTSRMRDVPDRHRSIRAVFDSSWELLDRADQGVYAALSVFQGSFTAEAVQEVIGASMFDLDSLCEKSLVEPAPDETFVLHPTLRQYAAEIQFARDDTFLLHPTMRSYAQEKLNENHMAGVQTKHCHYYLDRLVTLESKIFGMEPQIAVGEIRFGLENIRAAWDFAVAQADHDRIEKGADTLAEFFLTSGRFAEGEQHFGKTAEIVSKDELKGHLGLRQARFLMLLNKIDEAVRLATEARMLITQEVYKALALLLLGEIEKEKSHVEQANRFLAEGYEAAEAAQSEILKGRINLQLGMIAYQLSGDTDLASDYLENALGQFTRCQYRPGIAQTHTNIGLDYYNFGDYLKAREHLQIALNAYKKMGDSTWIMRVRFNQGNVEMAASRFLLARDIFQEIVNWKLYSGFHFHDAHFFLSLGTAQAKLGQFSAATNWLNKALESSQQTGNKFLSSVNYFQTGVMNTHRCHFSLAKQALEMSLNISEEIKDQIGIGYAYDRLGWMFLNQGQFKVAKKHFYKALNIRQKLGNETLLNETMAGLLATDFGMGQRAIDEWLLPLTAALEEGKRFTGAEDPYAILISLHQALKEIDRVKSDMCLQFAASMLKEELIATPKAEQALYLTAIPSRKQVYDLISSVETDQNYGKIKST